VRTREREREREREKVHEKNAKPFAATRARARTHTHTPVAVRVRHVAEDDGERRRRGRRPLFHRDVRLVGKLGLPAVAHHVNRHHLARLGGPGLPALPVRRGHCTRRGRRAEGKDRVPVELRRVRRRGPPHLVVVLGARLQRPDVDVVDLGRLVVLCLLAEERAARRDVAVRRRGAREHQHAPLLAVPVERPRRVAHPHRGLGGANGRRCGRKRHAHPPLPVCPVPLACREPHLLKRAHLRRRRRARAGRGAPVHQRHRRCLGAPDRGGGRSGLCRIGGVLTQHRRHRARAGRLRRRHQGGRGEHKETGGDPACHYSSGTPHGCCAHTLCCGAIWCLGRA